MKNKTQNATLERGESLKNILYVWESINQNQEIAKPGLVEVIGSDKTNLSQNMGKAPPGCSRSSGYYGRGHPPENKGDPPIIKSQHCIEKEIINKYQKLNYYKLLNLFIMKKQILFLALFSLALIFASTKSYGQVTYVKNLTGAPAIAPAIPLACAVENELKPLPGKVYNYTVTVPAGSKVLWFVTDQATIIDGTGAAPVIQASRDAAPGNYILTAPALVYNTPANTANTIAISWKSFDGAAKKVVLVAHVTDVAGCTNNVEVYRIEPSFAFTLDMIALLDAGTAGATECVSPVESASYDGTTRNVTINYGENWVYYSVNAANFVHSWMPKFTVIGYTGGGGTGVVPVADIQWAYPTDAVANLAWNAVTVPVLAKVAGGAVGSAGETIVIRVRIDHANNQNAAGNSILTFGVDGTMYDPAALAGAEYTNATLKDLDNIAVAPCTNTVTDQADYTLTPRPSVVTGTGTPILNFEPKL
jgi:hypothetical protein